MKVNAQHLPLVVLRGEPVLFCQPPSRAHCTILSLFIALENEGMGEEGGFDVSVHGFVPLSHPGPPAFRKREMCCYSLLAMLILTKQGTLVLGLYM